MKDVKNYFSQKFCPKDFHHHHQAGERTHLLVVPGVHSNNSVEEVLSHVSFQPQSISKKHPSFFTAHQKSQTTRSCKFLSILVSKNVRRVWKLALNNKSSSLCRPQSNFYDFVFPILIAHSCF